AVLVHQVRWIRAHPGRGRTRYLVLLVALAVLHLGLAEPDGRPEAVLPVERARHGTRHHLLLGRAHGDGGVRVHGLGSVPSGLSPRNRAGRARAEALEVAGELVGSDRVDGSVRFGFAPDDPGPPLAAGRRHPWLLGREGGSRTPLREQAVERVPARAAA